MELICPVCGKKLENTGTAYVCECRHSFDIAADGHVNLLSGRSGGVHGDEKAMLTARRRFFDRGYYAPIRAALASSAAEAAPRRCADIGCGEGYYTSALADAVGECCGIDISKCAVAMAAKRYKNAMFAAASAYALPFADSSLSLCASVFAPYSQSELLRTLEPGGVFLRVIPLERHLFGLKEILYETVRENPVENRALAGLTLCGERRVSFAMELSPGEDIMALYGMTPYCHRTPRTGADALSRLDTLRCEADVALLIYRSSVI